MLSCWVQSGWFRWWKRSSRLSWKWPTATADVETEGQTWLWLSVPSMREMDARQRCCLQVAISYGLAGRRRSVHGGSDVLVTIWVSSTEGAILQCELLKASGNAAVSLWWHLNVQLPRFGIFVTWWVQYPSADKAGQIGVRKKERQSASEALPSVNWNGIEKISPPLGAGISPPPSLFLHFREQKQHCQHVEFVWRTCQWCFPVIIGEEDRFRTMPFHQRDALSTQTACHHQSWHFQAACGF